MNIKTPSLTVDLILFNFDSNEVVLIERKYEPHGFALPGGFVDIGESLEEAAIREGKEETNLEIELICQFHTYSHPSRDNRRHTASAVYIAEGEGELKGLDDAKNAAWFPINDLPHLVFDHQRILSDFKEHYLHGDRRFFLLKD